ncbi:MAG TPA: hypothetical protein P5290_06330 [Candidatus Methanomethylicus sp.]|nr:hypothetical protein [Candidatus Methanomethylicus sp.]
MREMLAEIEEKLIGLLKGKMQGMPEGSISAGGKAAKPPYVLLGNRSFTFERVGIAESVDRAVVDVEEQISCNEGACRLRNRPLPGTVIIEAPPGTPLKENQDFTVGYGDGAVSFAGAAGSGRLKGRAKYSTEGTSSVKSLRLKAIYIVEVAGRSGEETDAMAGRAVEALMDIDDALQSEGLTITPLRGRTVSGEKEGYVRIQLAYMLEKEMKVTKPVSVMKRVEVKQKENMD